MKLTTTEKAKIKAYLDAVAANLSGPERTETIADLESHIYEAIAFKAENDDSSSIVEAVISEMESPENYSKSTLITQSSICGLAITGAILLPFGLPVLWHVVSQTPAGDRWEDIEFYNSSLYHFLYLPLGIITMFLSPILGVMSIKRIRQAKGAFSGGLLAVAVAVFYPILLINLFVFIVVVNIMNMPWSRAVPPDSGPVAVPVFIIMPAIITALIVNALTFRSVYKKSGIQQPSR